MSFGKSREWSQKFAAGLVLLLLAVAVYHCWAIETIVHQSTFVIMVWAVAIKTRKLISQRTSNAAARKRLRSLAKSGTSMFACSTCFGERVREDGC